MYDYDHLDKIRKNMLFKLSAYTRLINKYLTLVIIQYGAKSIKVGNNIKL